MTVLGTATLDTRTSSALGQLRGGLDDMGLAVTTDLSAQLDATSLMADLAGVIDGFGGFSDPWSITTIARLPSGQAAFAADRGDHSFALLALAGIGDGATLEAAGTLWVEAESSDGILVRRLAPADAGVSGLGGTVQALAFDTDTHAHIGALAPVLAGDAFVPLAPAEVRVVAWGQALPL